MIYLVIINVLGFLIMGLDKAKAKKQKYRISENTLLFVALIGGSLGSYLGMYCFHHKTKHMKFYIGIPLKIIDFQQRAEYGFILTAVDRRYLRSHDTRNTYSINIFISTVCCENS